MFGEHFLTSLLKEVWAIQRPSATGCIFPDENGNQALSWLVLDSYEIHDLLIVFSRLWRSNGFTCGVKKCSPNTF
ncbi:hypothetical protein KDA_25060 [Dictyobacter alpinus]|uniref:Uncharacterized protein n=1 Tax=Dictyobacter alpinus TaxID=2014873 RepID=A0A402B6Q6_9CHLR|nr:hypothetical protein KDA_25060 [Dictyobacter alpinus]